MKLSGLTGSGSGKMGNSVFAVVGGVQIVRQYQPNVTNPSTLSQVNVRARMKLLSQLAAVYANVLAFQKQGLKSARNLFIEKNFVNTYASGGVAQITYENIQLTPGNLGLPQIVAQRASGTGLQLALASDATGVASRVVYVVFGKTAENALQFIDSAIVETAGQDGTFPATLSYVGGDIVIHAYGMRDNNAGATAKYASYQVTAASDLATLVANRTLGLEDYSFTRTRGTSMASSESEITPVDPTKARVFVTATEGGTATGGGLFDIGSSVTVVATAGDGYAFSGWKLNGTDTILSNSASYTFTLSQQTDLVAQFRVDDGGMDQN